jgi:hypothetical protein
MTHHAELNTRIQNLCEEAQAVLFAKLLDTNKVTLLRKRLLECAGRARDEGYAEGETLLRQTEEKLAARFPPIID